MVLAYVSRGASTAEYLKSAREALGGTGFVSVTDRAPLVAWLEGSSERLERLVGINGACFSCLVLSFCELAWLRIEGLD